MSGASSRRSRLSPRIWCCRTQAARVRQPWSRADFDDRFRFAGGAGARANIPFGPLEASWGVTEGGVHRIEMSIGERF